MIGQRLRISRRAVGLSLRDLATRIGNRVTAQAISKYERNESTPGSAVLMALADALGVSVDYLVGDGDMVLEEVEFRKKRLVSRREEARIEGRVLDLLERYLSVEELLGLSSATWEKPRQAPWPVRRNPAEAEDAARGLRALWSLGLDPVPNLVDLLEDRGVKVLSMALSGVDGLTAHVRSGRRGALSVIVVNREDWGERQRFTLAHELGHMVLDVDSQVHDEKASHYFAGAFLMPAETLRAELGRRRTSIGLSELFDLKRLFGVSVQALTYRCLDVGIFGRPLFRRLFCEFDRRGWRQPPYREPCAMEGERPRRFERLCYRALSEGAVSESRTAELLGLSVAELNRRMDEPPDSRHAPA